MGFFEIASARDMLNKARRELARLEARLDVDNVFNFFVTAHHIRDYVKASDRVSQVNFEDFISDPSIRACRDICDKGKHVRLTKKERIDPSTEIYSGTLNGAPLGMLVLSGGEKWIVYSGSSDYDVEILAREVIQKWDLFFEENGL